MQEANRVENLDEMMLGSANEMGEQDIIPPTENPVTERIEVIKKEE